MATSNNDKKLTSQLSFKLFCKIRRQTTGNLSLNQFCVVDQPSIIIIVINIRSQCMNKNHKPNLSKKLIRIKFVLKRLLKIVNLQHYENVLVDYLNKLLEQKMISEISSEDYCSLLTGRELQGGAPHSFVLNRKTL